MPQTVRSRSWSFVAGAVIAALGVVLVVASRVEAGPALHWTSLAIILGAVIELAEGLWLRRKGGPSMAHLFSGVLVAAFAAYLIGNTLFDPRAISAPPVALLLGVFCVVNAVFRGMDVAVDEPRARVSEALDAAVTFVLGVVLISRWRAATPAFVALVAGLELIAGGLSLVGSARLVRPRAEQRPSVSAPG